MATSHFDGSEGGMIPLKDAATLTSNYRASKLNGGTKGHFFGKKVLRALLRQRGCVGLRVYYGLDAAGNQQLVVVAAKANKNDILDLVADLSLPCPDQCSATNVLNS
jgi:hypothetical protein